MELKLRLVAMADVLGFKAIIKESGTLQVFNKYKKLLSRIRDVLDGSNATAQIFTSMAKCGPHNGATDEEAKEEPEIEHEIFNDTVVLWTRPIDLDVQAQEDFSLVMLFLDCVREMLLIGFADGLPFRVGIGFGESIVDTEPSERILIGKAFFDAHETEQSQNWIGASFHPKCISALEKWQDCFYNLSEQGLLVPYPVPCTQGSKRREWSLEWSMDWFLKWRRDFDNEDSIKRHFDEQRSNAKDCDAKKKWENTIEFFQSCEQLYYSGRLNVKKHLRRLQP